MRLLLRMHVLGILVLAVLVMACTIVPPSVVPTTTAVALVTQTPPPVLPTYTPPPTYTPLPTYTPYPTQTVPPSATPTVTPVPATATATSVPATPTFSPVPATATLTPVPASPTRTPTFTRTPLPCSVSYATHLHTGGQAIVQNDLNHNVRSQPTTSAAVLGQISTSQIVDVLDGPVCGNGMWWWYVRSTTSSLTGWTAEAGSGVWWLANYTGTGCTSTTQRIAFASGATSAKVVTTLTAGCTKSYLLRINAGQHMGISKGGYPNAGLTSMTVRNPAHVLLSGDGAAGTIWYTCATTGDYTITIAGTGQVQFDISVPPL